MSECNPPFRPNSTAIRPTMKNGCKQLLDESGIGTSSTALPNPDDSTHLATQHGFLGPRNPRQRIPLRLLRQPLRTVCGMRWIPDFGRPDTVEPPGWEAPIRCQSARITGQ